mgnify:CR=1 FL=1
MDKRLIEIAKWAAVNEETGIGAKIWDNGSIQWSPGYNMKLIEFQPEIDWNQTKALEEKMCNELKIDNINISKGVYGRIYKDYYFGKFKDAKAGGSGDNEKEAIIDAVIKHIERQNNGRKTNI